MNEEQYTELTEALNNLNQNTVVTNNKIDELQHYFIRKDEEEEKAQKKAQQEAEEKAQKEAEEKEANTKAQEEEQLTREAQQQTQDEIYTEQLQNINSQLEATNGMLVGNFVTDGIICGVLLLTILWNKLN